MERPITQRADNYNLIEEKWIPVLYRDGEADRVGICKALEDAHKIRFITLANPLDFFAVHRFILTLLYWKADSAPGVEQVRASLLKKEEIPSPILDSIKKETNCFNLFDKSSPFLQDPNEIDKKSKSAGSLFAELAKGTNIAHFHHGDDENMRICLPCTALGMLRVVPWSQAGGAGLTPSVHNAPPIMVIATGDNLAITLGLNLVPLDVKAGEAKWSGHFNPVDPTKPIPYLEAFTWNPRRIYLRSPQNGACWYCGQTDVPTVGKIVYMKNENTKKRSDKKLFEWQDPAAFYVADFKTIKSTEEKKAMYRDDLRGLLEKNGDSIHKSLVVLKNPDHEGWVLVIPCTNPANNKTFDHRRLELTKLSRETIADLLPRSRPPSNPPGLDGWKEPRSARPPQGIERYVRAAVRLLTYEDWAALSNVAYRGMHDSPEAFDVFSGLYWGLRDKKITGLPSRNVAWLMLKLMATVPSHVRIIRSTAKLSPLQMLPKRQINEGGMTSSYPVSFPRGPRLEAALRRELDSNRRKRHPEPVDWVGLCYGLDQLLD